jgi:hypothetical protein
MLTVSEVPRRYLALMPVRTFAVGSQSVVNVPKVMKVSTRCCTKEPVLCKSSD